MTSRTVNLTDVRTPQVAVHHREGRMTFLFGQDVTKLGVSCGKTSASNLGVLIRHVEKMTEPYSANRWKMCAAERKNAER